MSYQDDQELISMMRSAGFKVISEAAGPTNKKNDDGTYKSPSMRLCPMCFTLVQIDLKGRNCKICRCTECGRYFCMCCMSKEVRDKSEGSVPCFGKTCNFIGFQLVERGKISGYYGS